MEESFKMGESEAVKAICRLDCCGVCRRREDCGGCTKTEGHPFGGRCIAAEIVKQRGFAAFEKFKKKLIDEFNSLGIEGLEVKDLNLLNGFYVNLEYPLANGQTVKLLEDHNIYLGNQIEIPGRDRYYGIMGDDKYLLVCSYKCNEAEPQIVCYKKRQE